MKIYLLQYLDEVLDDIKSAKLWYKEQRSGLEEEFAKEVEICIYRVLINPTAYSVRYKNVRIAHPKRFPYNIHFYIDKSNSVVIITAIIHNKQQTKSIKSRR